MKSQRTIVHLITNIGTGGSETMLYKLLSRMCGYRNVVVSMNGAGDLGDRIRALGVPVHTLGMDHTLGIPGAIGRLLRLLKRENPQILQSWLYHADVLGLLAGKLTRVPAVAWNVRGAERDWLHYPLLTRIVVRLHALLSRFPEVTVVNSRAGRVYHEARRYRTRRWEFIPNGFEVDQFYPNAERRLQFRKSIGVSDGVILVGTVSRYHPVKDLVTFLRAARRLVERRSNVCFALVGRGLNSINETLTGRIRELGIEDHVRLLDERVDIPEILSGLDIFSLSSIGEGFPNVVGEAMACGVPCVVTDVGDTATIVGDTGRVVPTREPAAMAEAWEELIRAGCDFRSCLGAAARQRIEDSFSLDSVVKRYERLYDDLTKDETNPRAG